MAQLLSIKIKSYCKDNGVSNVDFTNDVILQDDMIDGISSPYIKEWNLDIAKPTSEQLSTYESAAQTETNNNIIRHNRLNEYPSLGDIADAIFKKEAGDATEFNSLATKRQAVKDKYPKS